MKSLTVAVCFLVVVSGSFLIAGCSDNETTQKPKKIDEEYLIYSSLEGDPLAEDSEPSSIFSIKSDGSDKKALFESSEEAVSSGGIDLSPDRKKIAFQATKQSNNPQGFNDSVYVMNADGSELKKVSPPNIDIGSPKWSPDGKQLVGTSSSESSDEIVVLNLATLKEKVVAKGVKAESGESPSPDWLSNSEIVFTGLVEDQDSKKSYAAGERIFKVSSAGGRPKEIKVGNDCNYRSLAVSPSGKKFAGVKDCSSLPYSLYVVDTNGSNLRTVDISEKTKNIYGVTWSPDEDRLVAGGPITVFISDDGESLELEETPAEFSFESGDQGVGQLFISFSWGS